MIIYWSKHSLRTETILWLFTNSIKIWEHLITSFIQDMRTPHQKLGTFCLHTNWHFVCSLLGNLYRVMNFNLHIASISTIQTFSKSSGTFLVLYKIDFIEINIIQRDYGASPMIAECVSPTSEYGRKSQTVLRWSQGRTQVTGKV